MAEPSLQQDNESGEVPPSAVWPRLRSQLQRLTLFDRAIIVAALIAIAISVVVPPWVYTLQRPGLSQATESAGYHLLFAPPAAREPKQPEEPEPYYGTARRRVVDYEREYDTYLIEYEAWRNTQSGVRIDAFRLFLQFAGIIATAIVVAFLNRLRSYFSGKKAESRDAEALTSDNLLPAKSSDAGIDFQEVNEADEFEPAPPPVVRLVAASPQIQHDEPTPPPVQSSAASKAHAEPTKESQSAPAGIGGWLIIPAIQVICWPVGSIVAFGRELYLLILIGAEIESKFPGSIQMTVTLLIAIAILVPFQLFAAVAFFQPWRLVPKLMIAYYAIQAGVNVFFWSWSLVVHGPDGKSFAHLMVVLAICAILIPYFMLSRRVEATFTEDEANWSQAIRRFWAWRIWD